MLIYILYNTLIYGSIAFIIASYYAYGKFLNIMLWSFMIMWTYTTITIIKYGFTPNSLLIILWMIAFYFIVNFIVIKSFSNEKQRDLFGMIFTLWWSLIIENIVNLIYGPNAISIELRKRSWIGLSTTIIVINVIITYIFQQSYNGKVRQAIYAQTSTVRSLWVHVNRMLTILIISIIPCIVMLGVIIANEGAIKPSDNLFYLIKWIWIMIMVWVEKKQYIFAWALIYVTIEYMLFVTLWLPIGFKETLILFMILIILLIKPEWLFTLRKRKL